MTFLRTALTTLTAAALTVGTAVAAPGVPPSLVDTDPSIAQPATDPFYTPPAEIPDTPGTLIRSQDTPHLAEGLGGAQKILYTSTTQDGSPVATSGTVIEPTAPWTGQGPTPTIVFSPGTRGAGDGCAPSRAGLLVASMDQGTDGPINLDYEYPFYAAAAAMGVRVVVADLIGLGTPGQHTYVNHTEEGHAALDAARAAVPAGFPVAFYGYSQGGGASAGAAELAGTYAPELNVKGTFAGAPPSDLISVTEALDNHLIGGVLGYALNGALARHAELRPLMDRYLNDKGKEFLASTADECIGNSVQKWENLDTRTLTQDGRSLADILRDDPQVNAIFTSTDYRLGTRPLNAPMLLLSGDHDDVIPHAPVEQLAADYCGLGGTVQFVADPLPQIGEKNAVNHALPMITNSVTAFDWILDRFNGEPAPTTCR
ncbi:lipase family protein [Corynebacterium nuruki]|nr:lipase family protein [Corynebacterium nuruki]